MMKKQKDHPIQTVSRRTGLSTHVIRVWEKRYQVVKPTRSETNRRFYSDTDIEQLLILRNLTLAGHRISEIAPLKMDELKTLAGLIKEDKKISPTQPENFSVENLLHTCLLAVEQLDSQALDVCLAKATISMSPFAIIENLLTPLAQKIGELWRNGTLRIVHEHFASNIIRPFLVSFIKAYDIPKQAPILITATPLGQLHEFGALCAMAAASACGWRAIYLGTNLPAQEIAAAAHQLQTKAVALSIVYPKNDPLLVGELQNLHRLLPASTKIIVGGSGVDSYQPILERIGATTHTNFLKILETLETI